MKKLKVLSIGLLLSCVQMYAADSDDGTTPPASMIDCEVVTDEVNNKLPKELMDDIERKDNRLRLMNKAKEKKDNNNIVFGSRYPCFEFASENVDSKDYSSRHTMGNSIGMHTRACSRRCCGKLWTGGVWLVTSAGSLVGWGGNTGLDKKKK